MEQPWSTQWKKFTLLTMCPVCWECRMQWLPQITFSSDRDFVSDGCLRCSCTWGQMETQSIIIGLLALVQAQCILLKTISTVTKPNCVFGSFCHWFLVKSGFYYLSRKHLDSLIELLCVQYFFLSPWFSSFFFLMKSGSSIFNFSYFSANGNCC